jgi:flagellar hook assembly protein FlgD
MAISYTTSQPGRVSTVVQQNGLPGCNPPNVCLTNEKYEESGTHSLTWAGTNSSGGFAAGPNLTKVTVDSWRTDWPKNAVVLFGTKPAISNVGATPAMFGPTVGTEQIAFDLSTFQSQSVPVTITVINHASLSVLRSITLTNQAPGHVTASWDGRADNGLFVVPGHYTITVSTTDSYGNQAQGQALTTVQY